MIDRLLSLFGICRHHKTTWPQGKERCAAVRCLDCGRLFEFNPRTMKRGPEILEKDA